MSYSLRCVRALTIEGNRLLRGSEFEAGPTAAYDLLRRGDVRLVDESDVVRLLRDLAPANPTRPTAAILTR